MAKQGKATVLNEEQNREFLSFLGSKRHPERNICIYLLGTKAGLRIGEIAKLKLTDILTEGGELKEVITLRSEVTKGKKIRTAFINNPELQSALVKYLSVRPKYKVDTLFCSQQMKAFSANSLSKIMLKLFKSAGFDSSSSHQGRRMFCSNLVKSGLDIVSVSKCMGHSSIQTTMGYVETDQNTLLSAIGNI